MITPFLEKLILERRAVVKTHNHGVGGVGTIPNPNNRTIVVTDILYHPFIDNNEVIGGNKLKDLFTNYSAGVMHTLKLESKQNNISWTLRDNFKLFETGGQIFVMPAEPVKIDTFFIAHEDVNVDIMRFRPIKDWGINFGPLQPSSKESPYPSGYGDTSNAQFLISAIFTQFTDEFGNFVFMSPLGKRAGTSISTPNVQHNFVASHALQLPANRENYNYTDFPLITFQYVEILEKYSVGSLIK